MRLVAMREPGGHDEDRLAVAHRAQARDRARDLVVEFEVADRRHPPESSAIRQTFIWRKTRLNAASSGSSSAAHLDCLVGERHRRDVLLVVEQLGRVDDLRDLIDR